MEDRDAWSWRCLTIGAASLGRIPTSSRIQIADIGLLLYITNSTHPLFLHSSVRRPIPFVSHNVRHHHPLHMAPTPHRAEARRRRISH